MKKPDQDVELGQIMAEEGSRGRRQPVRAVSLEMQRRIRRAAQLLADKNLDRRDYIALIRDDFGLPEDSPEFREFLKAWDKLRR